MTKKDSIINSLENWLITSKKFPLNSICKNTVVKRNSKKSQSTFISDLLITDSSNNNELAIFQFKDSVKTFSDDIELMLMKLTASSFSDILYFVVVPFEINFQIYNIKDNEVFHISLEDFPSYQSLISSTQTYKKLEELKTSIDQKHKKEVLTTTLFAAFASLIVALLFSDQFLKKDLFLKNDPNISKLDTVNQKLNRELESIKLKILKFENIKIDSTQKNSIKLLELNKKINTIESLINQNPKNLMEIQDLNYKINFLSSNIEKEKELYNYKLESMEDKLNTYTTIIFTLVVTIIGSLTAFTISTFKK